MRDGGEADESEGSAAVRGCAAAGGERDEPSAGCAGIGYIGTAGQRLCRRVREQGPAGLVSRKRGVPSNRRIAPLEREQFVALVRQHYADFGPELAREYLARDHGFVYSTETLRGWIIEAGLWKARLRRAKARAQPARAPRLRGRVGADRRQPPRLVRGPC
ncbi:MAG: helix-turn-helix domain-containing protein [Rubrivivax sp.]|nr:helix-turn-helix domain-containing protein [Rubrivivax sp.]